MGNRRAGQVASGNGPACSRNEKNAALPGHSGAPATIPSTTAAPTTITPATTESGPARRSPGARVAGRSDSYGRSRRRDPGRDRPGRGRPAGVRVARRCRSVAAPPAAPPPARPQAAAAWAPPPGPNSTCGPPPNPIPRGSWTLPCGPWPPASATAACPRQRSAPLSWSRRPSRSSCANLPRPLLHCSRWAVTGGGGRFHATCRRRSSRSCWRRRHSLPGLVTVGLTSTGQLLINLETPGLTALAGPPAAARPLLDAIAVELATAASSGFAQILLVGFGPELDQLERVQRRPAGGCPARPGTPGARGSRAGRQAGLRVGAGRPDRWRGGRQLDADDRPGRRPGRACEPATPGRHHRRPGPVHGRGGGDR